MVGLNETWRKGRKILDTSLRPGAVVSYRRVMEEKTREFLVQLLENPKDFNAHINLSVGCPLYRMTIDGQAAFREGSSCHSRLATTSRTVTKS